MSAGSGSAPNGDPSAELRPQSNGPTPAPTPISAPYWSGGAVGELRYQWCGGCELALMDPQPACTRCLTQDLEWRVSAGVGAVASYTIVWRPPLPRFEVPYAPAIVRVDEGFDLLTNIVGCTVGEVEVGMRVSVRFVDRGDDVWLPYFAPA